MPITARPITPCLWFDTQAEEMLMGADTEKSQRVTKAFLQMRKFDVAELKRAYAGQNR